jgi:serine/threonine-protein kinase
LNRFVQEAKAASALNHPNILTVYEIGEVDGKNYIATELIDGKTLREHLSYKEALPLNTILKIGVQVAEALSAAHQAGIIHRDIKPENIMLRKDGYAKVLDFGLAKLSEPGAIATGSGSEDATRVQVNTSPGLVMGTVSYMSPEQARGKETDARTDIWSLGVVLYEMLSGKVPFAGETVNHTIVSILEKEPLLLESVPGELQRIVRKSMTKDVEMRYQSARDLLIDLKNLRRDLDIQGELERSVIPNRETLNASQENATQMLGGGAKATVSGQTAATQNVTTSSSSLEYAVTKAKSHKLVTAIATALVIGAIAAVGYFGFLSKSSSSGQINSIAVMPFVNDSGNPDGEYLSDGMTETLINSLSQIPNLSVKARSSVFRYKGKEIDPKKVASELGVQAILTGRVIQRGDQLTLSLELIDGQTENTIWGNKYERKGAELVALQSEVARDVSTKLKSKLSGSDVAKVEKTYTTNTQAYQLYLKGKFSWNKRTGESLKQAAEFYRQAIEIDPNYALAYSGLAETYALFAAYSVAPGVDSLPQAKAAALRALEIDDQLAEAHTVLAYYLDYYDWDREGAEKEYRRAIELKPNYATAHQWFGNHLSTQKRFDESITVLRRAEELDPLSMIIGTNLGDILLNSGKYDEAVAQYKRTILRDPSFPVAHLALGIAYGSRGLYPAAIAETREAIKLNYAGQGYLGLWLAKSGQRDAAVKLLSELNQQAAAAYVPDHAFALIYLGLGNKEEALNRLDKEMSDRTEVVSYIAVAPEVDDLRSEPRFKAMLKRLNLPE